MANTDFQDRLRRISARSGGQQPTHYANDQGKPPKRQKPSLHRVGIGGAFIGLGVHILRKANQNYEAIRDASGIGAAAGFGAIGAALLIVGIVVIMRATQNAQTATHAQAAQPSRQPSRGARIFFSLLGLAFGSISSLYLFLSAAARFIDTDKAQNFFDGGVVIALGLFALSLLFGLVGLFLRGFALGRVPVYFVFGAVLTFATFKILRINVLEWQQFTAALQ